MDHLRYVGNEFGEIRKVPGRDYEAYYPRPLPRELDLTNETIVLMSEAEAALGRLWGLEDQVPNPALLIRPYMVREALASTRIEGTEASLEGVLRVEAGAAAGDPDIEEVLNYVSALEKGLNGLEHLPISGRLLRQLHAELLDGVRGRDKHPGEFRQEQNWIGTPGATIAQASFVPPPASELDALLADWEHFANDSVGPPVLVRSALLHYQLETIHPFLDGNGRLGRLMIILHLISVKRLASPILYLSSYFEGRRDAYYQALQGVRERGEIEYWIRFFLEGVRVQAMDAVRRAKRLTELRERYRSLVIGSRSESAGRLVDLLFVRPYLTASVVVDELGISRATALRNLDHLIELEIVSEQVGVGGVQRQFSAEGVVAVLEADRG